VWCRWRTPRSGSPPRPTSKRSTALPAWCCMTSCAARCANMPRRASPSSGRTHRSLRRSAPKRRMTGAPSRRPPPHAISQPSAAPARAPKDTGAGDELAALRAAAAAAAGTDTLRGRADTSGQTKFIGRERNQAQLNPEISVTGDVRASAQRPGIQRDNFDPREFEVGFQSALDPYSSTKIFVSLENGEVSVEEGYAYWTGLPGHIRFDIGKFRQQFGELNRWHLHALPETEYPAALRAYLGGDGLAGTGISLYRAFGGLGTHELTAQVTRSSPDALFGGSGRPTYLLHLLNFWQLTRSAYMQIGATGLYGTDPDSSLRTKVGGLDFRITWRPPAQALYREWTLRAELYALRKEYAGAGVTHLGW